MTLDVKATRIMQCDDDGGYLTIWQGFNHKQKYQISSIFSGCGNLLPGQKSREEVEQITIPLDLIWYVINNIVQLKDNVLFDAWK